MINELPHDITLLYATNALQPDDNKTLDDYDIGPNSTIILAVQETKSYKYNFKPNSKIKLCSSTSK